jgi:outer membrane protein assembly factor BamB
VKGALSSALGVLLLSAAGAASDWPQFRGPGGTAVSDEKGLPVKWGPAENVRWKAELPGRGASSPVVAGGRVYVTACTGPRQERLHVLAFDAATGKRLWERQFWATGNTLCHPKTSMAAPTPAADAQAVYALFASGDLVALGRDGDLLWYRALARDYPQITNQVGMAASPVLYKDVLSVPLETAGESFAAGLDRHTGRNRWKAARPRDTNWVTPLVLDNRGRAEALFVSANLVTAYDPESGKRLWEHAEEGLSPTPSVPSPAAGEGLLVTGNGVALRLPAPSASEGATVAWKSNKLRPAYASPLYYRGRLYGVNNTATLLNCFDMKTGEVLWRQRVKGPFSASPVAGDGKVFLVNEDGLTTVLQDGPRPRVLGTNALGEPVLATPAISGGALLLRSDGHLFCIQEVRGQRSEVRGQRSEVRNKQR